MLMPPVSRYMTRGPYSVESTATLERARDLMALHAIRHLPVIDGTSVVGVISRGDVGIVEAVPGISLAHVEVGRIMTPPTCVSGEAPLDETAATMCEQRLDCVVISGARGVEGIFTATDALRALGEVLSRATV